MTEQGETEVVQQQNPLLDPLAGDLKKVKEAKPVVEKEVVGKQKRIQK
jgi:hypothetical protein